jgi:hypothetical protein
MAQITVLRPDETDPPVDSMVLAPRTELPREPVVGIVANGKPLAKELLHILVDELSVRLDRRLAAHLIEKPSAAYQISAEEADGMAARAHLVITGLGD